jgi:multidrug efflux pump
VLYIAIPKGLLPEQDTGLITGVVQADDNVSFDMMKRRVEEVATALRATAGVDGVAAFVGAGSINPTLSQGQVSIVLKPRADRGSLERVLPKLQRAVANIPGIALYLKPVQDVALDARVAATEYQYTLTGIDTEALASSVTRIETAMRARPELADVTSNLAERGLALKLDIDRNQASRLGVPIQRIDDTLYDAFGQRQVSTIFTEINQYRVVLEVDPRFRTRSDLLEKLGVRGSSSGALTSGTDLNSTGGAASSGSTSAATSSPTSTGSVIPLSALATVSTGNTPLVISHQDQLSAVTLSFNVARGHSLSEAVAAINEIQRKADLPPQIRAGFVGKAAEFSSSLGGTLLLILAAVVVIYIVLGVLYESYVHPLTILSTLPPAGVGALLALYACGMTLSIDGIVGIILLIGIVKKNAIMMIDFAIEARRTGLDAQAAIRRACLLRFRPIMMTTMAALLGALPLALGNGIGSELRRPLGVAIVGGLLLSQLVTLYTTPVIYLYFEELGQRWRRRQARASAATA